LNHAFSVFFEPHEMDVREFRNRVPNRIIDRTRQRPSTKVDHWDILRSPGDRASELFPPVSENQNDIRANPADCFTDSMQIGTNRSRHANVPIP
jgi:hypothetical protein